MADSKQHGILLEAGTNELEVLVFSLGKISCGVNVAKVREVIGKIQTRTVPRAHPSVIGVTNLRGRVLPIIDLQLYFYPDKDSEAAQRHVIVTEFNDMTIGFMVDEMERIYRLRWEQIRPIPLSMSHQAAVTSICQLDDKIVLMIDFEKIAFDIRGVAMTPQGIDEINDKEVDRSGQRLLIAEDSGIMMDHIHRSLQKAGFGHITKCSNGREAWERIAKSTQEGEPRYDAIISDVEMPQMDGLHLCRRIKEHPELRNTPVVVFSSIVSGDNEKKLEAVGADAGLTKPALPGLIKILDRLIDERKAKLAEQVAQAV